MTTKDEYLDNKYYKKYLVQKMEIKERYPGFNKYTRTTRILGL